MRLSADDPRAIRFDVYLWVNSHWVLQEACIEADDGLNGYVRVEEMRNGKLRIARYFGTVRFVRKVVEQPQNPARWGKKDYNEGDN